MHGTIPPDMRIIELDGTKWREVMDFYRAILPAIAAPRLRWHKRDVEVELILMP